jgi:hypothetical protein
MILKPQDLLLVLKLATEMPRASAELVTPLHMPSIVSALGLSSTEAHEALKRASAAGLLSIAAAPTRVQRGRPGRVILVNRAAVIELVQRGVRYVFVPERGRIVRGMPTGAAAPVLQDVIQGTSVPSVWPDPRGEARGESFSPLYRSVVKAARADAQLYALLALVDAIRGGSAREREIAADLFAQRVSGRG